MKTILPNTERQQLINNVVMLAKGYNAYIVEDACGETSQLAHDAAMRRSVQAGAVPMTTVATVLEFQRDWAKRDH